MQMQMQNFYKNINNKISQIINFISKFLIKYFKEIWI